MKSKEMITYTHKIHNKVLSYSKSKEEIRKSYNHYVDSCKVKKIVPTSLITLVRKMFLSQVQLYFLKLNEEIETNEAIRNDKDNLSDTKFKMLLQAISEGDYGMYDYYKKRFNILPYHEVIINKMLEK